MKSFIKAIQVDVVRIIVTNEDETIQDFYVLSSVLENVLNVIDQSELPDSAEILVVKPKGCEKYEPIIKLFVSGIPVRFSRVHLRFEHDEFIPWTYMYVKQFMRFYSSEITDSDVFNLPFFNFGFVREIVFDGGNNSEEGTKKSLDAIQQSNLKPKNIYGKITVTVEI